MMDRIMIANKLANTETDIIIPGAAGSSVVAKPSHHQPTVLSMLFETSRF